MPDERPASATPSHHDAPPHRPGDPCGKCGWLVISAKYVNAQGDVPEHLECGCERCGFRWVNAPCEPPEVPKVTFGFFEHDLSRIPWPWPGDLAGYIPLPEYLPDFAEMEEMARAELQDLVGHGAQARAYVEILGDTRWCLMDQGDELDVFCMHPQNGVVPIAHLAHLEPETGLNIRDIGGMIAAVPELARAVHHLHAENARLREQLLAKMEN